MSKPSVVRTFLSVICLALTAHLSALQCPFEGKGFKGRIAYSADGNFNDPDDWAASPIALAIFGTLGVQDQLVHFDYNCILPKTDAEWEKKHADGVLGAAKLYGFDLGAFHDCQTDLEGAIASIRDAVNASSAERYDRKLWMRDGVESSSGVVIV